MSTNFSFARRWMTRGALTLVVLFVLATLLAPMATAPAQAGPGTTRYVSPSGTDSGSCAISACKTITYALTQATPGDTISVAAGTYSAANGETLPLVPAVDVTISGAGASSTTIDGGGMARVMTINKTVTVQNMTIANGWSDNGGGILNSSSGNLTVSNSTFSGNSANEYGGGGIYNNGMLTVRNSTFLGNSVTGDPDSNPSGGGIYNRGTLIVSNSTFSGNQVDAFGGGIYNADTLTVSNSTFSGNVAAIYGGGIYNAGTLNYANTIIANSWDRDCINSGTISTNTNNLVQDGSCNATFSGNPMLGALANNGGTTQTFALQSNSPAIDAGDAATCAASPVNGLDQRGQTRNDLQCDIGAYEMQMSDRNSTTLNPGTAMRTFGPPRVGIQYSGTNPGSTTATKVTNWTGGTPANALGAWWELTPTTNTGLNLTLKLCYSTAELGGLNESDLRFWRYDGSTWSQVGGTPTFSGTSPNRCAQISGVTALSRWTLATGNPGRAPTAVTLSSFDARAADLSGWQNVIGLAGIVALVGAGWFAWRKRGR
ncbi:MAG: DUF1565 domain-containing protein [Anaerolineae bacterium]|nr:DUF1565 domain-containing protein [Anaerolineae bacterium]